MTRRPFHRLAFTLFVILSLLSSQLAMAGHACAMPGPAPASDLTMPAGHPCEHARKLQAALCHGHCAGLLQLHEVVKTPTPSLPMIVQALEMPRVAEPASAPVVASSVAPELRPPPDPVFLSTLRLRV
jgi:hypothetical protein